MTHRDDRHNGIGEVETRRVLELKHRLLPPELVTYAQLYTETTGLVCRVANQRGGESSPPLTTLDSLEQACNVTVMDILDTVREEHPDAIESVIEERGL